MYTLLLDVQLTRRQSMCYILDDAGDLQWSGKSANSAFAQLLDIEELTFHLEAPEAGQDLLVTIQPA